MFTAAANFSQSEIRKIVQTIKSDPDAPAISLKLVFSPIGTEDLSLNE